MSCPRCGGMLAAELAAMMDTLVCGKTVFESSYCHCDDFDCSMGACLLPEEAAPAAEPPNDCRVSEMEKLSTQCQR
jgi:ribosomal protein S27AE